jgi:hypothetical protein
MATHAPKVSAWHPAEGDHGQGADVSKDDDEPSSLNDLMEDAEGTRHCTEDRPRPHDAVLVLLSLVGVVPALLLLIHATYEVFPVPWDVLDWFLSSD